MANRRKKKPSFFIVLCLLFIGVGLWLYCRANHRQGNENIPIATTYASSTAPEASLPDSETLSYSDYEIVDLPDTVSNTVVCYPGFRVSFNPKHKQPNWVAWELTKEECESASADRSGSNFMPDPDVQGCASLADYKNSGFDRGHMCPAADMKWSKEAMDACHYLTNICPQTHALNGGSWNTLEQKCRAWAMRDSAIVIICGPVLTDRLTRTIGPNNVSVPERFFKVVLAPYAKPMRGIGFIMANSQNPDGIQSAAVSIDEVESITGYDFFSCLPDDIENKVESQCNFPQWNQKK